MEKIYGKYEKQLIRYNYIATATHAVSLLLVLAVLFIPYFSYESVTSILPMEQFTSLESYLNYLKRFTEEEILSGYSIELMRFSIFDEFISTASKLFEFSDDELKMAMAFISAVFPLMTIIFGGVVIYNSCIPLYHDILRITQPDQHMLVLYDDLRKANDTNSGNKFLKNNFIVSMFTALFFSIFYPIFTGRIFSGMVDGIGHMYELKQLNAFIILPVVVICAYCVLSHINKKLKNDIRQEILKNEYNTAAQYGQMPPMYPNQSAYPFQPVQTPTQPVPPIEPVQQPIQQPVQTVSPVEPIQQPAQPPVQPVQSQSVSAQPQITQPDLSQRLYIKPDKQKSKVTAGLLGIFLGGVGAHNFYLGYTGKAIAQIVISVVTCGIGVIAVAIWAWVEAIMIFTGKISTEANGLPLK